MESTRQKKIGVTLQKDLTIILQKLLKEGAMGSIIASVTKVRVSPDLSSAKVYISVFPVKNTPVIFDLISQKKSEIRNSLGILIKNQIRRVPELFFYNDDSLEHIDSIDAALKKNEDPIKNTSLLEKRKKI
jgi:ribosome-binding factor A|tara:strand:- start:226 stop:618 length:393 start_codon:yes stop_codon:yes gene_type:complete